MIHQTPQVICSFDEYMELKEYKNILDKKGTTLWLDIYSANMRIIDEPEAIRLLKEELRIAKRDRTDYFNQLHQLKQNPIEKKWWQIWKE
jgi:hypothetical protein